MDTELTIRLATPDDLDEVMRLAVSACKENGFMDASLAALATEIYPALCQDHGLCPVIGPAGTKDIQGLALLRIGSMWYAPDKIVIEEKCVFVYPEFRSAKGGRARKLCEYTKKVADTLQIPLLIGVLSGTRTAGKCKMYQRIFGEPKGMFFLYGAETAGHVVT
jgi:hypothetical protein